MSAANQITIQMDKLPTREVSPNNHSNHSNSTDDIDGRNKRNTRLSRAEDGEVMPKQPNGGRRPSYMFPGYAGPGFVNINGVETPIPDVNAYQHKKTLAQGMMDLALLSANANQLRYVLETSTAHPYFYPSLIFISLSIIFQIAVGVGLIWNGRYNIKDEKEICRANKINNYTVIGIFIVTVVNVLISSFGPVERASGTPT
ncbi:ninjurin-1 isoform X2 [Drosophila busckii]|uniref:ninjurin-1 isoform X2 n=1 Tax=Drosophila busckii TaxID=30019 RepID=UPI00083EB524|nr:ninjurin-1 isoform X2 [Drosophila busckii]